MISAVILTKNEERNIKKCIEGLLWCDEVIVIDDHSQDDTVSIARDNGAVVYFHDLHMDFASQRNFGLQKARHEWVLFIDADERVSTELQEEIRMIITQRRNRYSGYYMKRYDVLWGRKLSFGETAGIRLLRLGKKEKGHWKGRVHEVWNVSGYKGELSEILKHYPHETVKEYLSEVNFYTDLRAEELFEKKVKTGWVEIILYTKGKFFQNYLIRLGFLDGIPGIISAIMMSFHTFLVRSKLWLLWHR